MIFWLWGAWRPHAELHPFQSQWLLGGDINQYKFCSLSSQIFLFYLQTVTAVPALSPSLQLSPRFSWIQVRARNIIVPALSSRLASASSERLGWYSFRVRQYLLWFPGQGVGGGGTVEQSLLCRVLHWLHSSPDTITHFYCNTPRSSQLCITTYIVMRPSGS